MADEQSHNRNASTNTHEAGEAQERSAGSFAPAADGAKRPKLDLPDPTAQSMRPKLDLPDPTAEPGQNGSDAADATQERKRPTIKAADLPSIGASGTQSAKDASPHGDDQASPEGSDDGEPPESADASAAETPADASADDADAAAQSDQADATEVADSTDEAADDAPEQPARDRTPVGKVLLALIALAIVGIIAAASWLAWDRWGRYDDHADMQGEWYVQGTAVAVPIGQDTITLAEDVVYHYAINDHDKTISYTFGDWKGSGRYWFSDDRNTLVITDGDQFTGTGNTIDDLIQKFNDMATVGNGEQVALPEGDGIIAFTRKPDPVALTAKEAKERLAEEEAAQLAEGDEYADGEYYDEYYDEYYEEY